METKDMKENFFPLIDNSTHLKTIEKLFLLSLNLKNRLQATAMYALARH